MDLMTKIFLTNLVLLLCTTAFDKYVCNEKMSDTRICGPILLSWLALSIVSAPVYALLRIWLS